MRVHIRTSDDGTAVFEYLNPVVFRTEGQILLVPDVDDGPNFRDGHGGKCQLTVRVVADDFARATDFVLSEQVTVF